MFARVFALLPLVALVAAEYQCNTGSINCCNAAGTTDEIRSAANALGVGGLLGSLGVSVDAILGLQCTSIIGSNKCTQQPICCEDNKQVGIINISCSPVTIL